MSAAPNAPMRPRCAIRSAGDSTWCDTCEQRWDTNEYPPPRCGLLVAPSQTEIPSVSTIAWTVTAALFGVCFFTLGLGVGLIIGGA